MRSFNAQNTETFPQPPGMHFIKKQIIFLEILLCFSNLHKLFNILKTKHDPHSLSILKIIDSEKRGYFNV